MFQLDAFLRGVHFIVEDTRLNFVDNGISQSEIIKNLSEKGKPSHQSNVSRDLAKLEERKCIHKLNNSYFPISKNQ